MLKNFFVIIIFMLYIFWPVEPSAQDKKLSDADIAQFLVGEWTGDIDVSNHEKISETGAITIFKKDGIFEGKATLQEKNRTFNIMVSGTWAVSNGVLTEIIKTCNIPAMNGSVSKDRVILINENIFKFKQENGKEKTYTRVRTKTQKSNEPGKIAVDIDKLTLTGKKEPEKYKYIPTGKDPFVPFKEEGKIVIDPFDPGLWRVTSILYNEKNEADSLAVVNDIIVKPGAILTNKDKTVKVHKIDKDSVKFEFNNEIHPIIFKKD